jgi:UDP-glucose 4-epimerase
VELKGKKCLVTGGAGFIGSHLVDKLMEAGCQLQILDNLSNGKYENIQHHEKSERFEFIQGSILEPADVLKAMSGMEVVFHMACLGVRHSISHPFENHQVNAEGTLNVLIKAREIGIERVIHCSSSEVYGTATHVPMAETHSPRPETVYGASKLAGEAYARAFHRTFGMNTMIIRPFNTYGPRSHYEGDAGEVIPKSIIRVLNKQPILVFGGGSQTRDFTYVEDIAQGLILAAGCDHAIGQTLNIGSGTEISIKDLAETICKITGTDKGNIEFQEKRPGDVGRLLADNSNFKNLCSWEAEVNFDQGIQKTVKYFENHLHGIKNLINDEAGRNW